MARESGYNTKQREIIRETIAGFGSSHFTVDDLVDKLRANFGDIGRATVYRALERMAQQGSVRKFSAIEGKSACWQYIDSPDKCCNHFHLHCKVCGTLIHCECDFLNEMGGHIMEHHGFSLDPSATVLLGVCSECMSSSEVKA